MTATTKALETLADKLPAVIASQKEILAAKTREMQELKAAGLIYAKPHMRAGKYFYLIFPSRNGERERRYVGADPKKIDEAKAAMRRAVEYDRLAAEVRGLEQRLARGLDSLQSALTWLH
jgi:hypothetical protein